MSEQQMRLPQKPGIAFFYLIIVWLLLFGELLRVWGYD